MAIITSKLRSLVAKSFYDKLTSTDTNNVYFFIAKSRPWIDPDATLGDAGVGLVSDSLDDTILVMQSGTYDNIPLFGTIKNLDTGELRQVIEKIVDSPLTKTKIRLNASVSLPWQTVNWAYKSSDLGFNWVDDNNPPAAVDSLQAQEDCFLTMIGLKKMNSINIDESASFVIPRSDWDSSGNTVYAPYNDSDGDLLNHPTETDNQESVGFNNLHVGDLTAQYSPGSHFVVVKSASNYHVFKCLDNGGPDPIYPERHRKSTAMPDPAQCNVSNDWTFSAALGSSNYDGYKWKLMYTLTGDQVLRYVSESWVPVRVALITDIAQQQQDQYQIQTHALPGTLDIRIEEQMYDTDHIARGFGNCITGTALPDQTGLADNQVRLSAGTIIRPDNSVAVEDDYFVGCDLYVFSHQTNYTITDFNSSTNVATFAANISPKPIMNDLVCVAPHIEIESILDKSVWVNGILDTSARVAKARAIVNSSGHIDSIVMIDRGKHYRKARVSITQKLGASVYDIQPVPGVVLHPEVSPKLGHGSNTVDELGGSYVMFFVPLNNQEGTINSDNTYDFMTENDFRVIGIIRNVLDINGNYASANTMKALKTLKIEGNISGGSFLQDEVIESYPDGSVKGYVVQFTKDSSDSTKGTITYFQDLDTEVNDFSDGTVIKGISSGITASIQTGGVESPEYSMFSGDILYIANRKNVIRSENQSEDIKIVLAF